MVRSKWKLIFVDKRVFNFYAQASQNLCFSRKGFGVKKNRSFTLTDLVIDKRFSVPSDRNFTKVIVNEVQIGMKFGSICLTKRIGKKMHLYNKVQKKQSDRKRALKQKKLNRNKVGKKTKLNLRSQNLKKLQ